MPEEGIADEALMRRFQEAFDESAFDEIIARYHNPALALARNLLGDSSQAQDAVQETFIRVVRSRRAFNPGRSFASWFYTILRNTCADLGRRAVRYARHLDELARQTAPDVNQPPTGDDVAAMLRSISPDDRDLLTCRVVHGMSFPEISELFGCSVETAKKRAQRALRRLRTDASLRD